jgi:beta-phosphoglucomutase-like phosphatase (HAD superfamily)
VTPQPSELISAARAVFFDFDGPICDVFSDHPASEIAERMLSAVGSLSPNVRLGSARPGDPIELLREMVTCGPSAIAEAESILRAGERIAVRTSRPTKFAEQAIFAAFESERSVGVVSNNSEEAINAYLSTHGLDQYVAVVIGRPYAQPDRMKPSPESLLRAATALGVAPADGIFIGDSITDVKAAQTAAMPCIGYAKRPARHRELRGAGASLVVDSMGDVARLLSPEYDRRARSMRPSRGANEQDFGGNDHGIDPDPRTAHRRA